jgi:predicted transcriptional regulator
MDKKDYSWIIRGKQRRKVLIAMDREKIPTDISKEARLSLNNTSDTLRSFVKKKIARCINEKEKTGRLYALTKKGKIIRSRIMKYINNKN